MKADLIVALITLPATVALALMITVVASPAFLWSAKRYGAGHAWAELVGMWKNLIAVGVEKGRPIT